MQLHKSFTAFTFDFIPFFSKNSKLLTLHIFKPRAILSPGLRVDPGITGDNPSPGLTNSHCGSASPGLNVCWNMQLMFTL